MLALNTKVQGLFVQFLLQLNYKKNQVTTNSTSGYWTTLNNLALRKPLRNWGCELSLLLFDPVPGDLLTVAQLDLLGLTNTFASKDLSNCLCLSRVLALYPYEPLPAILCHAPVLCRYPTHCMVQEEVTLGCHQGALMAYGLQGPHIDLPSSLCFLRIRRWLIECGTPLDHRHLDCTVSVLWVAS